MNNTHLSDAEKWSGAELFGQDANFSGVEIDSRRVSPGSLFVAFTGAYHDGHDHLDEAQALERLAAAWRQRFH